MKTAILITAAALALTACGGDRAAEVENDALMNGGLIEENGLNMANDAQPAATASSGEEYAAMVGASDLYEIESARLASEKSQNDEVRQLAQMIVTDHERSTAELRTAAQQAQPAITVSPQMNPQQQADLQALQAAPADQFDRLYLDQQVAAHQKALTLVQDYAQNGDVEPLKQHASTVAGPIQQHLERAQALSQQAQP